MKTMNKNAEVAHIVMSVSFLGSKLSIEPIAGFKTHEEAELHVEKNKKNHYFDKWTIHKVEMKHAESALVNINRQMS